MLVLWGESNLVHHLVFDPSCFRSSLWFSAQICSEIVGRDSVFSGLALGILKKSIEHTKQ